jgi:hypothetical protein
VWTDPKSGVHVFEKGNIPDQTFPILVITMTAVSLILRKENKVRK